MSNRRQFLASLAAAPLLAQTSSKPNIIFIMADDLGYGDLSCYGQETLETPNIDRLAAEGMRFTDVYAGSTVCAPSRCCLATGKHLGHATVRGNKNPEIPLAPGDVTFAEVAKQGGYATAMYGKWGVGGPLTTGHPNDQGFDDFYGVLSQWHAHMFYPDHVWENRVERFLQENFAGKGTYIHDKFTEKALSFVDENWQRPFLLYLPYTVPHTNNELGRATGDGMEVPEYGEFDGMDWPNPEKGFAAMVARLDRDVGRILDKLEERGIAENTVVFFTSDNGPHREGGHDPEFFGSRGGLRGIKRDLYEGGIRVPMLVRWPAEIEPGQVSDYPWAFWDFVPTVADLAGVPAPEGIDGISVAPLLRGESQPEHPYLYWEFHERGFKQAIRDGKWKAVRLGVGEPLEIYDLSEDLAEENDIAAANPDVVRRMEGFFAEARTESLYWPLAGG